MGVIVSPVSAVVDTNEAVSLPNDIAGTFNHFSLLPDYTSGVTDFDTYIASVPLHTRTWGSGGESIGSEWFSETDTTGAQITYDLGSVMIVDALAIWNEEISGIGHLEILGSTDGVSFASIISGIVPDLLMSVGANAYDSSSYEPQAIPFTATSLRYVRFIITDSPGPYSTVGGAYVACAIGEIAFRVADGGGSGEDVCAYAEDEDDIPQDPITWPECDLVPSRISVKAVSPTVSPGRSFTSLERVIQPDAGSWEIELQDIPIRSRADVLLWRDIESDLNGRANTILVPVYEGKPSSTILAAANVNIAIGAVVIAINRTAGPALEPGMHFSDPVGRMYRIKSVVSVSGNVYTVKIWPPIRTPMTSGDDLEFNKPVCRCRLASDDGMNVMLELLRYAKPSVRFLEDV